MSLRKKPLVRFETDSRARLVLPDTARTPYNSMPVRRRRSGVKGKPRVIKGRLNVRVAGYLGVQKLAPSKLIKYLPANKVKQAAKRVLLASGVRPSRGGSSGSKRKRRKGGKKTRSKRKKSRQSRGSGSVKRRTTRRRRKTVG